MDQKAILNRIATNVKNSFEKMESLYSGNKSALNMLEVLCDNTQKNHVLSEHMLNMIGRAVGRPADLNSTFWTEVLIDFYNSVVTDKVKYTEVVSGCIRCLVVARENEDYIPDTEIFDYVVWASMRNAETERSLRDLVHYMSTEEPMSFNARIKSIYSTAQNTRYDKISVVPKIGFRLFGSD